MTAITLALAYRHNNLLNQSSRRVRGYHMDLKLEKILILADTFSAHRL